LTYFDELAHRLGAKVDRKGYAHCPCPGCGKGAAGREGDTHFSFGEQGGHCFVCGYSCSLFALGEKVGAPVARNTQPSPRRKKEPSRPPPDFEALAGRYTEAGAPAITKQWQAYRPLITAATVAAYGLGIGQLLATRCRHPRLTYPVWDTSTIVAIRGRAIDCDCPKWLNSGGSKVALWGAGQLRPGAQVIITESPVDAMLLMQEWPTRVAVASTGGAGTWKSEWTQRILQSTPSQVTVLYDNDSPGELGAAKVHASLVGQGAARVHTWRWPADAKEGADISDLLTNSASSRTVQVVGSDHKYPAANTPRGGHQAYPPPTRFLREAGRVSWG